jgi:glycosyltransferase involved in cell wall biosynthesis
MRAAPGAGRQGADKPVTVLQVLPQLLPGGVERDALDVAGAVAAAGGVSLVATSGGPLIAEVYRVGAQPVFLPLDQTGAIARYQNAGRIGRALQKHGVDLVHMHSRLSGWSVVAAAQRCGLPLVTSVYNHYVGDPQSGRRPTAAVAEGDRILAVSDFAAEQLATAYPETAPRLRIVDRGIDLVRLDPERVTGERMIKLARDWRLVDGRPLVLVPARFLRCKGHAIVIEAVAALAGRDLHCLLLGFDVDGPEVRAELEQTIARRGLGERIRIVAGCGDLPAAYMLADVVVSASTSPEAYARTIVEAQAMGRPVVATGHGDAALQAGHGKMAWLVPPGDAGALAGALGQALSLSAAERRTYAPHAIALARARLSQHVLRRQTLQVYDELLRAGPSARRRDDPALASSP